MESGVMVKNMDLEDIPLQIRTTTKESLLMEIGLAEANTLGLMAVSMKASGRRIK